MKKIHVKVGGNMEQEASQAFIDAWHRAEKGDEFIERHIAFESWETLTKVMTGKRLALLGYVRHHEVTSIRALSIALARDYSNVHADVQALINAGLLENKGQLRTRCERIETSIVL